VIILFFFFSAKRMQHFYSGLWARLWPLVSSYYHRREPRLVFVPVRSITLLLAWLLPVFAWAQTPAFTTSRTTGTTYTSINATGTNFSFTTLSGNAVTDDNTSTAVTLPAGFAFSYLGAPVTGFVACTNGWLSLDPTVTANGWDNNLGGTSSNNTTIPKLLAPMWDDLVCQGDNDTPASLASSMKYQMSGTAPNRVLTVEWIGMEVYLNDGPNLNFQVKLFETTNVIQYQYGIMSGFDGRRNYNYTYSLGLNGATPASTYLAQQTQNSNFFAQTNATTANAGANGLTIVPASYSQLQFTPSASLVTGTNPSPTVPANDETAGAITLPVGSFSPTTFATTYSSANATASAGITACSAATPGTPDDDVWFKFTTTSRRNVTVTLRGSGGYDGVLQVFSNAGTTALACVNATAAGLTETYTNTNLPAGTYYVRVYEAGTGSGTTGQFAIAAYAQPPAPANNECATAIAFTSDGTCTPLTGTSLGATASGNPATCNGNPDDDVWYSFTTAATARAYTLTMDSGTDFDGVVQVLSGACGSLTSIACVNSTLDGGIETVPLNSLNPNTTYYVRVYHAASGAGSGDFTLCLTDNFPRITSFTPTSGPVGTSVVVAGTGLTGATSVNFNGTAQATITTNTANNLTVAVPAGATTGTLTVTTPIGTSAGSTQTFTVCPSAIATTQNVALILNASGSTTLASTAVNNGSTANCGPAAANTLTVQKVTTGVAFGEVAEGGTLTLTAPTGGKFVSVEFASYGTPTGTNGTYATSGCNASTSLAVVRAALLGNNSGNIEASNNVFGDPCNGTVKKLAVRATYIVPVAGSAPATQLTYSCADLGTNYVELAVTDTGNNTSTAVATVTVVDNIAPAAGPLPVAPAAALANVPEAKDYGVLYQLDIQNAASFNTLAAVPYTVNNSGAAVAQPARVAYYMELTSGGVSKWVWASVDNFASTLTQLGLPHPSVNPVNWDQSVTNLNVFASANAGVTTGTNVGTGRLEMWRFNYSPDNVRGLANASTTTYDFSDRNDNGSNYGSFQVHNLTAGQTLLAYNNWGGGGTGGGIGDLGIGNQVGGSGNPDWTFSHNTSTYTVKRLYILVPNVAPFTQSATVALDVNGTATVTGSQVTTAAATDNCGVASITVSPNTFTCAQVGTPQTVLVTLTDASGNSSRTTATVNVTAPITATTTWNGAASTTWSDCANWSFGKVPDAATNAIIPTGLARYPVLNTGTVVMKDLTINNNFALGSAAILQVNGNFTFNGTATLGGTIALVGTATQQVGGTSTATTFPNLTVTKTVGTVELQRDLPLDGTLTFTAGTTNIGVLNTNAYRITLGSAATLNETETSYVVGKVAVSRTLAAGTAQSFGGIGLTLMPTAGSAAPGLTPVVRTTGTALTGVGTSVSVLRNFDIQPATRTGLNVGMVFSYFEHELNNIPESNLVLFKSETGASNTWGSQRPATLDVTANTMTKSGITSFSIWTLGDAARPLPVELMAFTATAESSQAVRLNWATASEKNSAYFAVERSLNGASFTEVGTLPAAGTSNNARSYQLHDTRLPAGSTLLYYRLRQVDTDGTLAYSPVQIVKLANAAKSMLTLAPNPTHGRATLTGAAAYAPVQVLDAVGRVVYTTTADAAGTAQLTLPAGQLIGVYLVRTGQEVIRLVLQ
jgi:hypothetical protein